MKWIVAAILWILIVLFIARFIGVCSRDVPRERREDGESRAR